MYCINMSKIHCLWMMKLLIHCLSLKSSVILSKAHQFLNFPILRNLKEYCQVGWNIFSPLGNAATEESFRYVIENIEILEKMVSMQRCFELLSIWTEYPVKWQKCAMNSMRMKIWCIELTTHVDTGSVWMNIEYYDVIHD